MKLSKYVALKSRSDHELGDFSCKYHINNSYPVGINLWRQKNKTCERDLYKQMNKLQYINMQLIRTFFQIRKLCIDRFPCKDVKVDIRKTMHAPQNISRGGQQGQLPPLPFTRIGKAGNHFKGLHSISYVDVQLTGQKNSTVVGWKTPRHQSHLERRRHDKTKLNRRCFANILKEATDVSPNENLPPPLPLHRSGVPEHIHDSAVLRKCIF